MKASDDLHKLILALTMQEKRYFKIIASSSYTRDGQNNYIRLFDAIEKQKIYDEGKIKNQFKGEIFIKHLPSEKNYLFSLIQKSLRQYHSQTNIDMTIKELLIDAEVLHEKSLYPQCKKVLTKTKKLAYKYERFVFIPEIIRIESRLYDMDSMGALAEEERSALKKMKTINRLRVLSNKVAKLVASAHHLRKESELTEFDKIVSDDILSDENKADSFTAKIYFFYINGVCYEMKGDLKRSYKYRKHFVEIAESNPRWMEIHVKNYLPALNNLAISQMELKRFDEMSETIYKIRSVGALGKKISEDIQLSVFIFASILEMNYCLKTGDVKNGIYTAKESEAGLKKFSGKIHKQYEIVLHNSIKYIYFGAGELRKSLLWSNKVINESFPEIRQDIQAMARIFNLILHYELGNTDSLEYFIKSTYRFLLKSQRLYKVETIVLNYLRRNANLNSKKEILESFRKLHKELLPLSKDRFEKKAFDEFDILKWLEKKTDK
ncbi:MAG: hypothetical protein HY841_13075 [Bacteroidetes bacterium]|nr:hypothetical protein [Bacteroidota bacterium]